MFFLENLIIVCFLNLHHTCTTAKIFENDVLIIIKKISELKFCTAVWS